MGGRFSGIPGNAVVPEPHTAPDWVKAVSVLTCLWNAATAFLVFYELCTRRNGGDGMPAATFATIFSISLGLHGVRWLYNVYACNNKLQPSLYTTARLIVLTIPTAFTATTVGLMAELSKDNSPLTQAEISFRVMSYLAIASMGMGFGVATALVAFTDEVNDHAGYGQVKGDAAAAAVQDGPRGRGGA
jgi:hypothetical protein